MGPGKNSDDRVRELSTYHNKTTSERHEGKMDTARTPTIN